MKRLYVKIMCFAVASLLLLGGCSSSNTPSTKEPTASDAATQESSASDTATKDSTSSEQLTIGCIVLNGTDPHCALFEEGFRKTVEDEHGDIAVVLDAEGSAETLINCITDLMSQQVDGIVLESCDDEAPLSILKEVKAAGIPVAASDLYLNTTQEDDLVLSQTISQNYEAGVTIAEDLIERANGEEINLLIMEVKQNSSGVMRIEGLVDTLEGHDNIKILERSQPSEDTVESKLELADTWMQKYDDIDAIFTFQDIASLACVQALKAADRLEGTLVYGVNGAPDALQAIKNGEMTATAKQQPDLMAKLSAEDVYSAIAGKEIDHDWEVYVPTILVDKTNVDEYLD